jgi:beta-xylosidase
MKVRLSFAPVLVFAGVMLTLLVASSAPALCNPLFFGADPDILIANKTYYVYPTGTDTRSYDSFLVYASPDLKTWKETGPVLRIQDISWINDDGAPSHSLWAPGVCMANGKYYLYFSIGPQNPTPSRIGVAVCDSPDGKFIDSGKPLVTGGNGFEAIDPMAFRDPKSGKHYLYCGGSAGAKLRVFELNDDMVSIAREIPVETPVNFTEGSFMHWRGGKYYLSYSHGVWNSDSYSVCYSTADSPTGPWKYKGTILKSNDEHSGPGHHAFFENPATGQWYVVYHRWNGAKKTGKMPPARSVCIDLLEYDKNGDILPVKMTDTGVAPSPVR